MGVEAKLTTIKENQPKVYDAAVQKYGLKKTSDKSDFHHITDSAAYGVLDFGMEGKTEQETTEGNQLFDINGDINKTYKGTESSVVSNTVENNILTTTGENLLQKAYGQCFTNLNGKTIIIAAKCVSLGTNTNMALITIVEDGVFKQNIIFEKINTVMLKQYTVTSDNFVVLFANTNGTGAQFSEIKVYEGNYTTSTIPEWEPFTNGPTPNPDYPQEIKNAGVYNEETGRYEIGCGVGNKNLCDLQIQKQINANGEINYHVAYGICTVYVPAESVVTLSVPSEATYILYFTEVYNDLTKKYKSFGYRISPGYSHTFVLRAGNNIFNVKQELNNREHYPFEQTEVQIEVGGVKTDYVPHASQPFTLTSDRPLTMWDKLVKRDGVWGWSVWSAIDNNFSLIQQTGDETIDGRIRHRYKTSARSIHRDNIKNFYCTHLSDAVLNSKNDIEMKLYGEGSIYITFYYETGIDTLDKATQWLADKRASGENITFVYETSTEQAFIPLPDEEQTLLNNLETYYGVTNVYNEQGCPMWIKYVVDKDIYTSNLTNEILRLGGNV